MEENVQTKTKANQKWIILLLLLLIVLLGVVLAVVLLRSRTQTIGDGNTPTIGYSAEATVMLDQDSLQAAFEEAMRNAEDGNIGLKYKNDAFSTDGTNFECYIVNSESNKYDMFLTMYADAELTDQIFLSELIPPGSGFEHITLDHALNPGTTTVYVALTQVDTNEETGEQVIKNQVMHTMDFHVTQ